MVKENKIDLWRPRALVTYYEVAERYKNYLPLVKLFPKTGRTHQIRVHMSTSAGPSSATSCTAACDGRWPAHLRPVLRLERPFLHARRLAFTHPTEAGRRLEFEAPLPDDLQDVLDDLVARAIKADDSKEPSAWKK